MNEESIEKVSSQLRQAMISGLSSLKICGMDWSKRPGNSEASPTVDDFSDQSLLDSDRFIVVHGAGQLVLVWARKSLLINNIGDVEFEFGLLAYGFSFPLCMS